MNNQNNKQKVQSSTNSSANASQDHRPMRDQDSPAEQDGNRRENANDVSFYPGQQNDQTDMMLNVTQISNNALISHHDIHLRDDSSIPDFKDKERSKLDTQQLNMKGLKASNSKSPERKGHQQEQNEYMSQAMLDLKTSLEQDDETKFEQIVKKDLYDSEEILMYLFCAVACFNSEKVFMILLQRSNYFKVNQEWHLLFSTNRIFQQLTGFQSSIERRKFDQLAIKIAIERDYFFMVDLILERSLMTKEIIQILLSENQKKLLVQQISKAKKPTYLDVDQYSLNSRQQKFNEDIERDLHFNDIVYAALDKRESSSSIIDLIKMMKNEKETKYIPEVEKEFNLQELFKIFVQRRKIKLIRFLFSLRGEFHFAPHLFIEALESEAYDIGALLYKEFFRKLKESKKDNEYIITILISSLNKNNGQIDFKAFLLRSYMDQFILRHAKHFLDTLDQKVQQENKFNLLVLNLNVVKTACLIIELLETLGGRFERLKVRCDTMRHKIEQITKKYMMLVETEQEMRYLLLEKDFENRDSLELITRYTISPFLESQFADNVVREIWRSPYATNNSLFSASSNHKLTFYYWNCIKDEETTSRFYQPKDLRTFEAHPLQFTVWRYSGKSRITVEFFATAILASIIHIFINEVLSLTPGIYDTMKDFLALEDKFTNFPNKTSPEYQQLEITYRENYSKMSAEAEIFFNKVMIVSYFSFLPLMFAFQHIFNIVYASINKRMINPYAFMNLLDFIIFVLFFANIMITYVKNLYGTWMDYPLIGDETRAVIYTRNYYGGIISEDVLWIICIVILWIRVFYFLRFNEFMGKFVGIVERLLYDVALFFCFYIIELIFFALMAELCFRRLDNYNTSYKAFKTLFYASMGQFSFDEIEQAQFGEYFGITFMIIFLVCNIGIVMNLFIAVITVLYDAFSEHENVYQMLETLKLRSFTEADKEYSAMISLPPPLNILNVVFAPILLTSKKPQIINEFILCIAYIPVMIGVTMLFIIYSFLIIPVAYVKLFFHKLVMIYVYSKAYRVSRADKFITFVFFVWFGPFTLTLNSIVDIWYFLKHLWLRDLFKTQHKTSDKQISKDTLEKVGLYFKMKQEKILPYKQVATEIRDILGIIDYVGALIHPYSIFNMVSDHQDSNDYIGNSHITGRAFNKKHLDRMFNLIKEYTTIKQIMERNSDFIRIHETNHRVKTIDCKIMHTMICDLQRYKQVLKVEDEDYIFIRRAINIKSQQSIEKRRQMESDPNNQRQAAQLDSEGSKESRKRLKIVFKKLLFLNTKRMLEVLNYKTGEGEVKKLLHAMKLDGKPLPTFNESPRRFGSFSGIDLMDVEEKVQQMGFVTPQLSGSLSQMKSEIANLIQYLSNIQHQQLRVTEKEKIYQQKINELIQDLNNVKEEKEIMKYYQKSQKLYTGDESNVQELLMKEAQHMQFDNQVTEKKVESQFKNYNHHKLGQPSPQKKKYQDTESDVPDVEDDDD